MDVLHPRCAGLDVHKDTVVAAARVVAAGTAESTVRTFDTTTPGLLALSAWLAEQGCTHLAMEATGVYWKPVWHVLADGTFRLILANAAHVKNVPGRKTDVADAAWLADLLAHGLIRPSFVPEEPTQAMRALLRTRKQLVREQASHVQRIQKTLEDGNLKLSSVLSQIMGKSGRAILAALIEGEQDPDVLLGLVERGVKAPPERLRAALQGRITDRHRFLLRLHLRQIDALDAAITEIDAEVERDLGPLRQAIRQLRTIPGISDRSGQVILSEIGLDMSRFPSAGPLLSWAGCCPRNDESAGKRRSTRLRKGAPWLRQPWCSVPGPPSAPREATCRPNSTACAVAASILTAIYHMLRDGTLYQDLGSQHFHRRSPEAQANHLARQITKLGCDCALIPRGDRAVSV